MHRNHFRDIIHLVLCGFLLFSGVGLAHAADGVLDPSFGNAGIVLTDLGLQDDFALDILIQADGRIVVAGNSSNGSDSDFALTRYNPDGSQDISFDGDGNVTSDLTGRYEAASAVAVQPDAKIVAAGSASNGGGFDLALARYNPDGSPDLTFGQGGKVIGAGGVSDQGTDVVLQPDGKILISIYSNNGFVVARFNSDGSPDLEFGEQGLARIPFACSAAGYALALQPDGKILLAGDACGIYGRDFGVARYQSDGEPDASFGNNGLVLTDFGGSHDTAYSIAVQGDGRIILAGHSYTDANVSIDFALARYNPDGSLDASFDQDGLVRTDLGGWRDQAADLVLQPDGGILVSGTQWQQPGATTDFLVARYHPDGSLDTSFGNDGKVTTDLSSGDYASSIALQSDGRVLVAGFSNPAGRSDFAVLRYLVGSQTRELAIDIKPNRKQNHINPHSRSRIKVAILSTPDFDALKMVAVDTIRFGSRGTEQSLLFCKARGRDVNRDGLRDLICVFSIPATGFVQGDRTGILTAQTVDGLYLQGMDSLQVGRSTDND